MGLLSLFSLFKRADDSSRPPPDDDFWYTDSPRYSVQGNPESAQRIAAVFAAVQILTRSLAQIPLFVYKRGSKGSKTIVSGDSLYKILHTQPNRQMTHFAFIEMAFGHVLLRGNSYSQILTNRKGEIKELIPLNPTKMRVELNDAGKRVYTYYRNATDKREFQQYQILHLTGYCFDGKYGYSPIQVAPEPVEHTVNLEEHGAKLMANAARPGGILSHPGKLSPEAAERLRKRWDSNVGGEKRGSTGILEEGMTWQQVGMSSVDAQYLEQRRFQIEDIARLYQVPPHMIGDLSRATYSNIEHQSINYVMFSLLPWCKKFEEELAVALLSPEDVDHYVIEFQVNGLMRGDIKSRYDAYAVGRNNGWLSANDIRSLENMNPLPGDQGDIYLVPLNMIDASTVKDRSQAEAEAAGQPDPAPQPPAEDAPQEPAPKKEAKSGARESFLTHATEHLSEITGRILRRDFAERRKRQLSEMSREAHDFARNLLFTPVGLILSALGRSTLLREKDDALYQFFLAYNQATPDRDEALQAREIAAAFVCSLTTEMKDAA